MRADAAASLSLSVARSMRAKALSATRNSKRCFPSICGISATSDSRRAADSSLRCGRLLNTITVLVLRTDRAAAVRLPRCGGRSRRVPVPGSRRAGDDARTRSEEHTSELQSLMRISYAVFCLQTKKIRKRKNRHIETQITNKQYPYRDI